MPRLQAPLPQFIEVYEDVWNMRGRENPSIICRSLIRPDKFILVLNGLTSEYLFKKIKSMTFLLFGYGCLQMFINEELIYVY